MAPLPFSRRDDRGREAGSWSSAALDRVPLMALLEPELRRQVQRRLGRRRLAAGKPLFRQGEAADALYLVESGRFRVSVTAQRARERVLRFAGPGDLLGEAAFIAETPHVTTAVAVDDASAWRLARPDFEALLGKHDAVLRHLAEVIAERQAQANARLAAEAAPHEGRGLRGYVTALYAPRGGAGVTTLAVTLAVALAELHPDDTALLDLDVLFGHTLANLWLEPRGVLAQASPITLQALDRQGLDLYLLPHASSLRVMPAATRPEDGQAVTADHVRAAISVLRRHFGQIVLDLPHSFSDVALAGLELADRILLIATPERATLEHAVEARRIMTDILRIPGERINAILNHPLPYAALDASDFVAATATPWTDVPFGGEGPTTAALRGESLLSTRPNNPVARAMVNLARLITTYAREATALSPSPSGSGPG